MEGGVPSTALFDVSVDAFRILELTPRSPRFWRRRPLRRARRPSGRTSMPMRDSRARTENGIGRILAQHRVRTLLGASCPSFRSTAVRLSAHEEARAGKAAARSFGQAFVPGGGGSPKRLAASETWEENLRRRADYLRGAVGQWTILNWAGGALQRAAWYAGHMARQDMHDSLAARAQDGWRPLHDATAWHLHRSAAP